MTTEITIRESEYMSFDADHLIEVNQRLENEVKRLRKDKEQLHEQLCLIKKFSDGLWDRLRIDI